MSEEFKREIRYDVVKLKTGKKVNCVVVEEDWPEYEVVWQMLKDRMEGRPNALEASQAREAALRAKLETILAGVNEVELEDLLNSGGIKSALNKKASQGQEQEPVVFCNGDELDYLIGDEAGGPLQALSHANGYYKTPLYKQPPIPHKLAELQRENAELRKLLESKVPEGWQLVPKEPTVAMREAIRNHTGCSFLRSKDAYAEVLAAAPQPKEPKQSPETDLDEAQRRQ